MSESTEPKKTPENEARLNALEKGLASLTAQCAEFARQLQRLLDSATAASRRRTNLIQELESLRQRVLVLENGQAGATKNLRDIIQHLGTTLPMQERLILLSADLEKALAGFEQIFKSFSPDTETERRIGALEHRIQEMDSMLHRVQATEPIQERLNLLSDELGKTLVAFERTSKPPPPDPEVTRRLALIEKHLQGLGPALQRLDEFRIKLTPLMRE